MMELVSRLEAGEALHWSPVAGAAVEVESRESVLPELLAVEEEVSYSVRVPAVPSVVDCPRCGRQLFAAGPTGYADEDPICDRCLLTSAQQLGMVLALVSVTRTYALTAVRDPEERRAALAELGAFARLYERFAARHAPLRLFLPRLDDDDDDDDGGNDTQGG